MSWSEYTRAVVRIDTPNGPATISPDVTGSCSGPFLDPRGRTVHVITAHNPGGTTAPARENTEAHRRLLAELAELPGVDTLFAVGADPSFEHTEDSVAVIGLTDEQARTIGAAHGQEAIFAWTPREWAVLSCTNDRATRTGWTCDAPLQVVNVVQHEGRTYVTFHVPDCPHVLTVEVNGTSARRVWAADPADELEPSLLPAPARWGFLPADVDPVDLAARLRVLARQEAAAPSVTSAR